MNMNKFYLIKNIFADICAPFNKNCSVETQDMMDDDKQLSGGPICHFT